MRGGAPRAAWPRGMIVRVALASMLVLATGCFSFCQFDREEEARNRREWAMEPEHVLDPVAYHASDVPVEGLDPPGPKPLFGPRRDPDTIPRERPAKLPALDDSRDAWEGFKQEHSLEEH